MNVKFDLQLRKGYANGVMLYTQCEGGCEEAWSWNWSNVQIDVQLWRRYARGVMLYTQCEGGCEEAWSWNWESVQFDVQLWRGYARGVMLYTQCEGGPSIMSYSSWTPRVVVCQSHLPLQCIFMVLFISNLILKVCSAKPR